MLTPYDTGFSIGSAVTGAVVGVTQSVGHAVSEHLDFSQWMKSGSQAEPVEATDSTADPHERERQLAAQRTEFNDAIGRLLELFQKIGLPGGSDFSVAQGLDGQWQVNGASELRGQLENQLNRDSEWNERLSKVLEEVKSLVDLTRYESELPDSVKASRDTAWGSNEAFDAQRVQLRHHDDSISIELN